MTHRAQDRRQVGFLLRDLEAALRYPHLLEQAMRLDDPPATLLGLSKWARHERKCKMCRRPVPYHREKCCSKVCAARLSSAKRRHRNGPHPWFVFRQTVVRPVPIALVAEKVGVTVEEAQRRAAADVRRGKLIAYPKGKPIREVGVPVKRRAKR